MPVPSSGGGWLVHIMDMEALLREDFGKDGVPREGQNEPT